jgi:hypothetical protein
MTKEVNDTTDCPFHYEMMGGDYCSLITIDSDWSETCKGLKLPDSCPLNDGEVTVYKAAIGLNICNVPDGNNKNSR